VGGGGLVEGEAASGGGASGSQSPVACAGGLRASVTASCRRGAVGDCRLRLPDWGPGWPAPPDCLSASAA
jgi:hypothetical protein